MKVSVSVLLLLSLFNLSKAADLVIFSYNRPMQLYALLESVEQYVTGITSSKVIVRADSSRYRQAYKIVQDKFAWVNFIYQNNPPYDFRELVMKNVFNSDYSYILFAVDDIIVKDYVDLAECVNLLKKYQAYTLLLRLGSNINYCYSLNIDTSMPEALEIEKGIYQYTFLNGEGDWAYPNNVDMSLYCKKDIYTNLSRFDWSNPNQMEGAWANTANLDQRGLFFDLSKIVNIPLNIVGSYKNNRNMNIYSDLELLERFEQGLKIDIGCFDKIMNRSAHIEHTVCFK
jgi:hypothetical protein